MFSSRFLCVLGWLWSFPKWLCEAWRGDPTSWDLWITNHLFSGKCLLISWPYHTRRIKSTFFFFVFFRASSAAYGSSQAKGWIGAAAARLCHSHSNTCRTCHLHHSSWQHWILNPLREARDRTHVLMDTSWFHDHRATTRMTIKSTF